MEYHERVDYLIAMPSSDTQFQGKGAGTKYGESPIAVRFPSSIRAALKAMPNSQDFVRRAVEKELAISPEASRSSCAHGVDAESLKVAIAAVLPTVPIKDRAIAAKAFRKLVAHLASRP